MTAPFDQRLFPFERHYFDRGDGVRMHFVDEGAGPPVLCVHGNPTWSFYYRNLILALQSDHRVLAPDHVGMGLSDKPDDTRYVYTLKSRVDDLTRFIASLRLKQPLTLVVHGWGAMIGFAWAEQHPESVARLVVLNSAAFAMPEGKAFPWQLAVARTPVGALLLRGVNAFAWAATFAAMHHNQMPADVRRAYMAPYDSWANRIAILRSVQEIPLVPGDPGFDVVQETMANLSKLAHVPMLIGWGGKDPIYDAACLQAWQQHFPRAEVLLLADAGHYVLEDAAVELVPLIAEFVREG